MHIITGNKAFSQFKSSQDGECFSSQYYCFFLNWLACFEMFESTNCLRGLLRLFGRAWPWWNEHFCCENVRASSLRAFAALQIQLVDSRVVKRGENLHERGRLRCFQLQRGMNVLNWVLSLELPTRIFTEISLICSIAKVQSVEMHFV